MRSPRQLRPLLALLLALTASAAFAAARAPSAGGPKLNYAGNGSSTGGTGIPTRPGVIHP